MSVLTGRVTGLRLDCDKEPPSSAPACDKDNFETSLVGSFENRLTLVTNGVAHAITAAPSSLNNSWEIPESSRIRNLPTTAADFVPIFKRLSRNVTFPVSAGKPNSCLKLIPFHLSPAPPTHLILAGPIFTSSLVIPSVSHINQLAHIYIKKSVIVQKGLISQKGLKIKHFPQRGID